MSKGFNLTINVESGTNVEALAAAIREAHKGRMHALEPVEAVVMDLQPGEALLCSEPAQRELPEAIHAVSQAVIATQYLPPNAGADLFPYLAALVAEQARRFVPVPVKAAPEVSPSSTTVADVFTLLDEVRKKTFLGGHYGESVDAILHNVGSLIAVGSAIPAAAPNAEKLLIAARTIGRLIDAYGMRKEANSECVRPEPSPAESIPGEQVAFDTLPAVDPDLELGALKTPKL